jgi:hypothetical protein
MVDLKFLGLGHPRFAATVNTMGGVNYRVRWASIILSGSGVVIDV